MATKVKEATYSGVIRVHYPLEKGTIVLRTEKDWNSDIEPDHVDRENHTYEFTVTNDHNNIVYKPCIREGHEMKWEHGGNRVTMLDGEIIEDVYPMFIPRASGSITQIFKVPSKILGRDVLLRLYLPAGYEENSLTRYPTIYMHDGKNLFFPQEAFLGREWTVDENLELLNKMSLVEPFIVVGVYAGNREFEYTKPGYESYGKSLVQEVKPWIDKNFRTSSNPWNNCVMGSSLGGVVSFYLGWEYPEVFGAAVCLSSTFGWKDNLFERVENDPIENRAGLRVYMDSGWPGDNYERTARMVFTMLGRGFRLGQVIHLAFPMAAHDENAWASRLHIPFQLFAGRVRRTHMKRAFPQSMIEGAQAAKQEKAPVVKAPALKAPAVKAPAVKAPAPKAPAVKAPAVKAPAPKAPAPKAPAPKAPAPKAP
ncbi:MAG: alpha/beta hydrolase-fold protein, partial [Candidatus Eremiobacteraeota bacterium]|nr:alpha/beta hydrolase-fold protein [Candidatus Eremiobacteraeota bacterium]